MNKKLVYISIFILICFVQLSFLPVLSGSGVAVDALLMAILAWSVIDGYYSFFNWAIFFGFLYDLASYATVGTHALIFLFVLYFVSFFSRRLSIDLRGIGIVLFLLSIFVATFLSNSIIAGVAAWKIQSLHGYWQSFGGFKASLISLTLNTAFFFLMFYFIRRTKAFFAIN